MKQDQADRNQNNYFMKLFEKISLTTLAYDKLQSGKKKNHVTVFIQYLKEFDSPRTLCSYM